MTRILRVLYVSAEASPFAKSGVLADAARALSISLVKLGVEISLILPKYRRPEIESLSLELVVPELIVPLGRDKIKASIYKAETGDVPVFFVDNTKYFCRDEIYGASKGEYLDNDERFTFFSRAVLEFVLKTKFGLDVIHCNDWPTALVPLFLRTRYARKGHFKDTATVFSFHDSSHQGKFPPESLALTGLNWDYFTPDQLALNGKFSFLKAGLIFSDALSAASSDWKAGILAGNPGGGLEEILNRRLDVFSTIHSGSDEKTWETAAKEYIELYAKALDNRRGGQSGR
jgi:starch synthase